MITLRVQLLSGVWCMRGWCLTKMFKLENQGHGTGGPGLRSRKTPDAGSSNPNKIISWKTTTDGFAPSNACPGAGHEPLDNGANKTIHR